MVAKPLTFDMKKIFSHPVMFIFGLGVLLFFFSCNKEKDDNDKIYTISGVAEPEYSSTVEAKAFGAIYGGYSAKYKKLAFNITWQDLGSEPKGSAFYFAGGLRADSVIKIFPVTEGNQLSGLTAGEIYITDEQAAELMNGAWSYSVNTVDHPNGEIKGKVLLVKNQ